MYQRHAHTCMFWQVECEEKLKSELEKLTTEKEQEKKFLKEAEQEKINKLEDELKVSIQKIEELTEEKVNSFTNSLEILQIVGTGLSKNCIHENYTRRTVLTKIKFYF